MQDLVRELGPRARAGTPLQAAEAGDIVVVTIPLGNIRTVPAAPLAGKIVIDTNNYYPQRDGHIAELDMEELTTSELLQRHLRNSKVVKAFNHIYAAALTTDGLPAGTPNRRVYLVDAMGRTLAVKSGRRIRSACSGSRVQIATSAARIAIST